MALLLVVELALADPVLAVLQLLLPPFTCGCVGACAFFGVSAYAASPDAFVSGGATAHGAAVPCGTPPSVPSVIV